MRLIFITLLSFCLFQGCSSKIVAVDQLGNRTITTTTDAAKFTEEQSKAWTAYYSVLNNPPVIATITQSDGNVIKINSQIPPPAPNIKQYQNQYINPIMGTLKTGVQIIGGGLVVKEIVGAMQGTNISNIGSGSVNVDQSDNFVAKTATGDSTIKENSENPSTITDDNSTTITDDNSNIDNSIEKADPVVVETTNTTETVKVVNPVVVNPEVVIVQGTTTGD